MSHRLFVSIDLPADICRGIRTVQAPFRDLDGIRPTDPDHSHVTLKFLGDLESDQIERVIEMMESAIEAAELESFAASVNGIGVFPSFEYIKVIWLAIETGATAMTRLHDALESRSIELGFEAETHDFRPHVTIARMEHAGDKSAVQELIRSQHHQVGDFRVSEIRLKESVLTADGPEYETIATVSLK